MYRVGEDGVPLCLDCYLKHQSIVQQQTENLERLANFAIDQIDAQVGFLHRSPRFPPRPVQVVVEGIKLQNISVSNSVVGVINTGSIQSVDQSISALNLNGETEVAAALKGVSQAILQSADLSASQKNELVEYLSAISKEASTPVETRQKAVGKSLLEKVMQITSAANDISDACLKWWPVLQALFP